MYRKHIGTSVFVAAALAAPAALNGQVLMGTAFTFQGQLSEDDVPVNGTADFKFTLWDAAAGGNPVSSTFPVNNVTVSDGLFTVVLDFGADAFNGEACWMEIEVRSPAGGGVFTTLSPRQELTPAPYSLHSATADAVVGTADYLAKFVDAEHIGDSLIYETASGKIGIGTTDPAWLVGLEKVGGGQAAPHLQIKGYADNPWGGSFLELGKSRGTSIGQDVMTEDGDLLGMINAFGYNTNDDPARAARIDFVQDGDAGGTEIPGKIVFATSDGVSYSANRMTIDKNGKVGIGTETPAYALDVSGDLRVTGTMNGTATNAAQADNADKVDNYHAGNASGQVAVSNGTLCTDLNADKLDGQHLADLDGRYVNEAQANSITSAMIKDGEVQNADLANNAVNSAKISDNSITQADIATDGVGAAEIAADAVGASEIAANAVGASEIASNAVLSAEIKDGEVQNADLADNAVNSAKISDNSITAADIAADGVGASEIAADAVGASEIAANAVGASEIADRAVGRDQLANSFKAQFRRVNTVNANEYIWDTTWWYGSQSGRPNILTTGTAGQIKICDTQGGVQLRCVIKEDGVVVFNGTINSGTCKTHTASDGKLLDIYVWPYTFHYEWFVHFTGARERYNSSLDYIGGLVRAGEQ